MKMSSAAFPEFPDVMIEVPVDLVWAGNAPMIVFGHCNARYLALPFWDEFTKTRQEITRMQPLDTCNPESADCALIGGVFHTTRCGSTLVMRQFSAIPGVYGVSEPAMIQRLLEGPCTNPLQDRERLRKLVAVFCNALSPIAGRLVMKWRLLAGLHAQFITEALPEVPNVFLCRNATEILRSIDRSPLGGMEEIKDWHLYSPDQIQAGKRVPDDMLLRAAKAIANVCHTMNDTKGVPMIDYRDLPEICWCRLVAFFGLTLSSGDIDLMKQASIPHSKSSSKEPFQENNGLPDEPSNPELFNAAHAHLKQHIDRVFNSLPSLTNRLDVVEF